MDDIKWSPPELLKLSGNYWSACALHAGVKLDLFTPLSQAGATATELAGTLAVDPRGRTWSERRLGLGSREPQAVRKENMLVPVHNMAGETVGEVELRDEIFGARVSRPGGPLQEVHAGEHHDCVHTRATASQRPPIGRDSDLTRVARGSVR